MTFSAYFTRKSAVAALLGLGLLVAATLAHVLWQASRAVRDSADQVASESQIAFTTVRFDQASLGAGRNATISSIEGRAGSHGIRETDSRPPSADPAQGASAFEWLSAPAVFSDAAVLDDRLYLVGPSGLFEYGAEGDLLSHYRVGSELPAAPPVAIAAGLSTRTAGRSLYVATAGEGLLILDRGGLSTTARPTVEQVRAEEAACRDLTAVLPLPSGRVLLGTKRQGVLVYDGKRLAPLHRALTSFHVTSLAGDEADLWVGTLDRGALHWQAGQLDALSEAEGLPDRQVLALAVADGRAYVGTPIGVAEFHNGRYQRTLASGFFANALLVQGRQLKVGTLDEGIVEIPLDPSATRAARPRGSQPAGPQNVSIQRVFEVDGTAYVLAEDGLYRLEANTDWRPWLGRGGALLTDRNISALAADSAGRLWIGYFDRGLDILSASGDHVTHVENQHVFCVNRIAHHDERGLTAVATANGLVLFDAAGRQQQVLGRDDGLIANHVTDVAFGSAGMAVATPAGITFLDSQGPRSLYAFHGLVNNHVYALASVGDRLLAGTLGGLSVLDGDVVRASYTTGNSGLKHNWITAIVRFDQEWFVGTYGSGILQLDSFGQWHALPGGTANFEVNPNAMVAGSHRIYAGALGLGLGVYERGAGRWIWITEGLPSANVTALALHAGYLYVGTDNGLVRIAEHRLLSP